MTSRTGSRLMALGLILISHFFTVFGIDLMIAAYRLKDPFSFIMTFFAASLIILISLALLAGFVNRLIRTFRQAAPKTTDPSADRNP